MEFKIRKFKKGDGGQVAALLLQVNKNSEFSEDGLLAAKETFALVAEIGPKIVGFGALCFRYVPSHGRLTASIEDLTTDPEYRRRGIGGSILDRLIEKGRKKRLLTINLSSNKERSEAHPLYPKKGFKELDSKVSVLWL